MERIGNFARRCQTTIKTLRFYDKSGLLSPDYIDTFTGYRYYGPEKTAEMQKITGLKEIGFTLDEIRRYNAADERGRSEIIRDKRLSLAEMAEEAARRLKMLDEYGQNLSKGEKKMDMDLNAPFENDERAIGRWEFIATVENREEFKPENEYENKSVYEELYFLPGGEKYWGFGWTKGFLIITFDGGMVVPYELREAGGQTFMFLEIPGFGGVSVLGQADNKRYTKSSITKKR